MYLVAYLYRFFFVGGDGISPKKILKYLMGWGLFDRHLTTTLL